MLCSAKAPNLPLTVLTILFGDAQRPTLRACRMRLLPPCKRSPHSDEEWMSSPMHFACGVALALSHNNHHEARFSTQFKGHACGTPCLGGVFVFLCFAPSF